MHFKMINYATLITGVSGSNYGNYKLGVSPALKKSSAVLFDVHYTEKGALLHNEKVKLLYLVIQSQKICLLTQCNYLFGCSEGRVLSRNYFYEWETLTKLVMKGSRFKYFVYSKTFHKHYYIFPPMWTYAKINSLKISVLVNMKTEVHQWSLS